MEINPSKSILDQVDEYLHENHNFIDKSNNDHINNNKSNNINIPIHNDIHLLERELSKSHEHYSMNNINNNSNVNYNDKNDGWIPHNIQLDLDKLNHSIFQENSFHNSNNIPNFSNIPDTYYNSNHTFTSTNHPLHIHKEVNNMLNIPVTSSLSPTVSPLIAPNQASMNGIQVTPFMHPLTLKTDFGYDNKNTSTSNNDNRHSIVSDSISMLDPLSTLNNNINDITVIDDYGSKIVPLTRSITSTSKNENSNMKNKISVPKKSHSMSGQSAIPRSDQSTKVAKNSPYIKPNRSLRRFSKSKTSLENTPILPSTNITTITTPILNSGNSGNSNNSNNNKVQGNIPGNMNDVAFQLPESSVILNKSPISLNPNIDYDAALPPYTNNGNHSNTTNDNESSNTIGDNTNKNRISTENVKENNSNISSIEKRPRSKSRVGRIKDESKREIHKVAEQERRNRLNNALSELTSLIPEELKKTVSIPSKATTAELACVYIRQLKDQLAKRDS